MVLSDAAQGQGGGGGRQEWHYKSRMHFGEAIVFHTGRTPHTSFSPPGEEVLAALYARMARWERARDDGELCAGHADWLDGLLRQQGRGAAGGGGGQPGAAAAPPLLTPDMSDAMAEHLASVAGAVRAHCAGPAGGAAAAAGAGARRRRLQVHCGCGGALRASAAGVSGP